MLPGSVPFARRLQQAGNEPNRNDENGTKQEITPKPAHRVETHVPNPRYQVLNAAENVARIKPERGQDHPDEDRKQYKAHCDSERRSTDKARHHVVGHADLQNAAAKLTSTAAFVA